MKVEVTIIGAGLFGSFLYKYLISKGKKVLLIDDQKPLAGSKCSLGIFKDSWISSIQDKVAPNLPTIEKFAKRHELEYFDMDKGVKSKMSYFDKNDILEKDFINDKVSHIEGDTIILKNNKIKSDLIVICAGVWTNHILFSSQLPLLKLDCQWGASFDLNPINNLENRVVTWSPYKQSCLFNLNGVLKFSDGVTVKNPIHADKRIEKRTFRITEHLADILGVSSVDNKLIKKVNEGNRPYLPKDADYITQHSDSVFSITGGRKNSTVLTGYIANKFYKMAYGK